MNSDIARKMKKINEEYFSPRDTNFVGFSLKEGDTLEFIPENPQNYNSGNGVPNIVKIINQQQLKPTIGFRLKGGRLKIV